jgi:chloramphenicol 3-O phosphotransferase
MTPYPSRVTGAGKVILIHGASSSGKTTLARALQATIDEPFWHYSIDHFRDSGVLPMQRIDNGDFAWSELRDAFFEGFHRCLPALALAGNNLIVEHIVETEAWMSRLLRLLESIDVFFVGLHCPLAELEQRERQRGDRPPGDALRDYNSLPRFGAYDVEIDSTRDVVAGAQALLSAWRSRTRPSAFDRLSAAKRRAG